MKKLLSITLTLALALSLYVTAFADDTTITYQSPSKSGSTSVSYTVAPAYSVTIPEKVAIGEKATVSVSGVKVAKGWYVAVRLTGINESVDSDGNISSESKFTVKTAEGASLAYAVKIGETEITAQEGSNTVLTVASGLDNDTDEAGNKTGASKGSAELAFTLAEDEVVQYAGTYTGNVTFTVKLEEESAGDDAANEP